MANERDTILLGTGQCILPHIDKDTAAVQHVTLPCNRKAIFLSVSTDAIHDSVSDELTFSALSPDDRVLFQLLLYLTYCCKGCVLQVTLEDPDFRAMSPPIREDNGHGRLFCFVLNMDKDEVITESSDDGDDRVRPDSSQLECTSRTDPFNFFDMDVDVEVFRDSGNDSGSDDEVATQAFNAFMRLQVVRKKLSSLNNAMTVLTDQKSELSAIFDWVDVVTDTLIPTKVDRKTVRELQGSLYAVSQSGKNLTVLPQSITRMNLKTIEMSVSKLTDIPLHGKGRALFDALIQSLSVSRWHEHNIFQKYTTHLPGDLRFMDTLRAFVHDVGTGSLATVNTRGLLVFQYTLDTLIDSDTPDLFTRTMLHKHVPVSAGAISTVLANIRRQRRTVALARMLESGSCECNVNSRPTADSACSERCQTAYACYYNNTETHPFHVSKHSNKCHLSDLYPHLGRLARVSREIKQHQGGWFSVLADMVFSMLTRQRFGEHNSMYTGLSELVGFNLGNAALSLGRHLEDIHHQCYTSDHGTDEAFACIKAYDAALVKYMFCDTLGVSRLFQISTTFNYIISNTAPRYTVERIMLFNITGPGEGKSYANNILDYQFRKATGCIERLTSFTLQAFKYKQKRNACVVMIDDAHITHEKNTRPGDKESHVIPNTFKNLLDTSILESDIVTKDATSGRINTVKYHSVHNCGFVWNTNTTSFISDAWGDRCLMMVSEFPKAVSRTRSTANIRNIVEAQRMDRIAELCLYRQNLVQSATMIANSEVMQFGERFDRARDACIAAFHATHIVCTGTKSRRTAFCINQLVFAEAMKLACHFVFDIWIPPWTALPDSNDFADHNEYMRQVNANRLRALDRLSFGQLCLEVNVVYKLCTAACLPDICPRVLDTQGRFACRVLGYVLTETRKQNLKTLVKNNALCVSGLDDMFFSPQQIVGGSATAHEMLMLCSMCRAPTRSTLDEEEHKTRILCTYKCATGKPHQNHLFRGQSTRKVTSVTVALEMVYDMLAIYAPESHSGFWAQVSEGMLSAYNTREEDEEENAMGQYCNDDALLRPRESTRLTFRLDFTEDPLRSLILEATAGIKPLDELTFTRCTMSDDVFMCSAPLYYGSVLLNAFGSDATDEMRDNEHVKESQVGPRDTFHGPRLTVYTEDYTGVPVLNMSSFCKTRTTYHQDRVILTNERVAGTWDYSLEEDWEWKDACQVFNDVLHRNDFSVDMLKKDYAVSMINMNRDPSRCIGILNANIDNGQTSLSLRTHNLPGYTVAQRSPSNASQSTQHSTQRGHKRKHRHWDNNNHRSHHPSSSSQHGKRDRKRKHRHSDVQYT